MTVTERVETSIGFDRMTFTIGAVGTLRNILGELKMQNITKHVVAFAILAALSSAVEARVRFRRRCENLTPAPRHNQRLARRTVRRRHARERYRRLPLLLRLLSSRVAAQPLSKN